MPQTAISTATQPTSLTTSASPKSPLSLPKSALAILTIMTLVATIEYLMGRSPISQSGKLIFWVGDINSAENSQQITDWYTFTHFLHGFFFYAPIRLISRGKWPFVYCLLLAVTLEGSWEILENSPFIINRYRNATIAIGYIGDSILNSMSDILFCLFGFLVASRLPVWASLAIFISLELGLAYMIHDNLTLNIIMLIHPFEAIKQWQSNLGVLLQF